MRCFPERKEKVCPHGTVSSHNGLTLQKKTTGTTHVDQHRVGKAMVCAHSATVLSSREQTTNTEAQLSFARRVKKTEDHIKTTVGRKQGSGHSAH